MKKEEIEKLICELEDKLFEIKEQLGYDPLKICGDVEWELNFDFGYYRGQLDLLNDLLKKLGLKH